MDYTTEPPFTGAYTDLFEEGMYVCSTCKNPLYTSAAKFHSGCGWPSFDDELPNAVLKRVDADGSRIEILCAKCRAHLGHLFRGELFTPKNQRHCVNSYALQFIPKQKIAVFGCGCFWCTEALFSRQKGVLSVTPGYAGGWTKNPQYEEVCTGTTGHAEVVRIAFDPTIVSYDELLDLFWKIHDPTSLNRQGHDIGSQYRSIILYTEEDQKTQAKESLKTVSKRYLKPVVTEIQPLDLFYEAEDYHKNYYEKNCSAPYCQTVISPKIWAL